MISTPNKEQLGPGEESVWDYPRPPRLESSPRHIQIIFNGITIADTQHAKRVLETSHPPVYYIPPEDVRMDLLAPSEGGSFCEWKGQANYFSVHVGDKTASNSVWSYRTPSAAFSDIAGYLAFYPAPMDVCLVDGERVQPQPGGFYGGWITSEIKGPFKGERGTAGW